jgi:hypothetical protein
LAQEIVKLNVAEQKLKKELKIIKTASMQTPKPIHADRTSGICEYI